MDEIIFSWSEIKASSNFRKHGVTFDEAQTVFADEFARLIHDPDHSLDEERFILLGMSSCMRVLAVCHCERRQNVVRIFSARKADKAERMQYEAFRHA